MRISQITWRETNFDNIICQAQATRCTSTGTPTWTVRWQMKMKTIIVHKMAIIVLVLVLSGVCGSARAFQDQQAEGKVCWTTHLCSAQRQPITQASADIPILSYIQSTGTSMPSFRDPDALVCVGICFCVAGVPCSSIAAADFAFFHDIHCYIAP